MESRKERLKKLDWYAIIFSLFACVLLISVGEEEIWTDELIRIILPLTWVYMLLPYIVRVFEMVNEVKEDEQKRTQKKGKVRK